MNKLVLATLVFLMAPVLLSAAPPPPEAPAQPAVSPTPSLCPSPAAGTTLQVAEVGALAVCTADCWDGTTRTCSGSSCEAVDSNCSTCTQGYCSSDTELKGCPACPSPVCKEPSCDDMNGTVCKTSGTCYMPSQCTCKAFTCRCFDGRFVCP